MAFPTYTDNVVVEGHHGVHHFNAAEDVTQGQLVELDTDSSGRGVEPHDVDGGGTPYGFALYTQSSGSQVAVAGPGTIVRAVSAAGTISSGDLLSGDGSTNEGEVDTAASGDRIVGIALEDDTEDSTEGSIVLQVVLGQFGD